MANPGNPVRLSAGAYNRALELAGKVRQGLAAAGEPPFYTTQALKVGEPGHHRETYVGYPDHNSDNVTGCHLFELYHDTFRSQDTHPDWMHLSQFGVRTYQGKVLAYNPETYGQDVCEPEADDRCDLDPDEVSRLPAGIVTWPGMAALYGVVIVGNCCNGTRHADSPATPSHPGQTWWHECRPLASYMGQPWCGAAPPFYRLMNQSCHPVLAHGDGFDVIKLGGPCGTSCRYLAFVRRLRWFCEDDPGGGYKVIFCPTAYTIFQPTLWPEILSPLPEQAFMMWGCTPSWWGMKDEPTNAWYFAAWMGSHWVGCDHEYCSVVYPFNRQVCFRGSMWHRVRMRLCPTRSLIQIDTVNLSCGAGSGEVDIGGSYYDPETGSLALRFIGWVDTDDDMIQLCVYEVCVQSQCPPVLCWPANWTGVQ